MSDSGCWNHKVGWDLFTTMALQVSQADKDGTQNSQTENRVVYRSVKSASLPHAAVVGVPWVPGEPRKARSRDARRALSVGSRNDNVGAAHEERSTTRRNDVRAVGRL